MAGYEGYMEVASCESAHVARHFPAFSCASNLPGLHAIGREPLLITMLAFSIAVSRLAECLCQSLLRRHFDNSLDTHRL